MIFPYITKCKHCGKRISLSDMWRFYKAVYEYVSLHYDATGGDMKEIIRRGKEKFEFHPPTRK